MVIYYKTLLELLKTSTTNYLKNMLTPNIQYVILIKSLTSNKSSLKTEHNREKQSFS